MIKILLIVVVVMVVLLCIAAIKEEKDALRYKKAKRKVSGDGRGKTVL